MLIFDVLLIVGILKIWQQGFIHLLFFNNFSKKQK